jgi:hypothetical protein
MPYVEFEVPAGTAAGIAGFYEQILDAPVSIERDGDASVTRVAVGNGQDFIYRETDRPLPPYDGHHVQIYIADFSGPHRRLLERGLITEESDPYQYRFRDLVDPETGRVLFAIEHEVRSMTHPLFARPLVNRDPAQSNLDYAPGFDARAWGLPPQS